MVIAIPLSVFLYIYFTLILFFFIFYLINIRQLFYTGSINFLSFLITFGVLAGATLSVFFTWQVLGEVDWSTTIKFFDSAWLETGGASF